MSSYCVVKMKGLWEDFEVVEVVGPISKKEAHEISDTFKDPSTKNGEWQSIEVSKIKDKI